MTLHRLVFAMVAMVLLPPLEAVAVAYVCTEELSAGIAPAPDGKWRTTTFESKGVYVVERSTGEWDGEWAGVWLVKIQGFSIPQYPCKKDFELGVLSCLGLLGHFNLNQNNLRFSASRMVGYTMDHGDDTPMVSAGTCITID